MAPLAHSGWIATIHRYFYVAWLLPVIFPFFFYKRFDETLMNFPHLVERCQLITIISFGETVLGIIQTYPLVDYPIAGFAFFVGMSMMFIAYISQTYLNIEHHQMIQAHGLIAAHVILVIGVNIMTVAIEFFANPHHAEAGFILFLVSLYIYYIGLLSTSIYNRETYRIRRRNLAEYASWLLIYSFLFYALRHDLVFLSITYAVFGYIMTRVGMLQRRRAREAAGITL